VGRRGTVIVIVMVSAWGSASWCGRGRSGFYFDLDCGRVMDRVSACNFAICCGRGRRLVGRPLARRLMLLVGLWRVCACGRARRFGALLVRTWCSQAGGVVEYVTVKRLVVLRELSETRDCDKSTSAQVRFAGAQAPQMGAWTFPAEEASLPIKYIPYIQCTK